MFQFKHFSLHHEHSTQKIGTDSVLLGAIAPIEHVESVLDIGCGCGVIAFCISDRIKRAGRPFVHVTGIDVDADSIHEAKENAALFPYKEAQFDFLNIALQDFTPKGEYDLIVSNPPYFSQSLAPTDDKRRLSRHRDFTLPFSELVAHSARLLRPSGKFYIILPTTETACFQEYAEQHWHLTEQIDIRPTPDKPIHRMILGYSPEASATHQRELCIHDERHQFSREYRFLTQDFYLDF